MLCYGGHLTLVNLVLTCRSFFMMSFLEIPKGLCKMVISIILDFSRNLAV